MANETYLIPVVDTISTAWNKVKGAKGSVWAAFGIFILIMFGINIIQALFGAIPYVGPFFAFVIGLVGGLINLILQAGIINIGIKRALDAPISYRLMFAGLNFELGFRIICLYLMKFLIYLVPIAIDIFAIRIADDHTGVAIALFALTTILVIYIAIRLFVALAFVIDKGLGAIDAINASIRATRSNFWNLLGILILQICIAIVAVIPLGIGLIWAVPLGTIIYGTVYKRLSVNA